MYMFVQNVWAVQICSVLSICHVSCELHPSHQLKVSPVRTETAFMIQNFVLVVHIRKYPWRYQGSNRKTEKIVGL